MKPKKELSKHKEAEEKKEAMQGDECVAPAKKEGADDKEPHADADQDKELIKSMLKKHMGDEEHSDEDMAMACEAYEFHKGKHESEKAAELAVESMRAAKHLASKGEAKKEGEEPKEEPKAKDEEKKEEAKELAEAHKEIAKLKGEISALKESQKKVELKEYIDKVCRESKLSNEATKSFRESLKESIKTVAQVDEMFSVFKAGREAGQVGRTMLESGLAFAVEKTVTKSANGKSIALGDCKK